VTGIPSYLSWRQIDYHPAIPVMPLDRLAPHLPHIESALEVGCNTGSVAILLAQRGVEVLGVDINDQAIHTAQERAAKLGLGRILRFCKTDILESPDLGYFDLVLLVRTLTCFPDVSSWQCLLRSAHQHIKSSGLIYVHDFMICPGISDYEERYREGQNFGWRAGNFPVRDASGKLSFVAHHHSDEELHEITRPYQVLYLDFHSSLSMNGNECKMFEFIGRKI
jgi:SAM-dependent methyltransferase